MKISRRLSVAAFCLVQVTCCQLPALAQQTQYQPVLYPYYVPQQVYPYYYQNNDAQQAAAQQYAAQQYAAQQAQLTAMNQQSAKQDSPQNSNKQDWQDNQQEKPAAKSKKSNGPTPFEIQDQAIKKALAENTIVAAAPEPDYSATWSSTPSTSSPSKLKGIAATTGKIIGKTAAMALPTVGIFFLTRAMNQSYLSNQFGGARGHFP